MMELIQRLSFPDNTKDFNKGYNLLYDRCSLEQRELLNFIMIEASCGVPFVNNLRRFLPNLIKEN